MTEAQPTVDFKEDLRNSVELETYLETEESVEEKEFETFWDIFYPRVHIVKERTFEEFEQIYKETREQVKDQIEESSKKKGEPDFQDMKLKIEDLHQSIVKEINDLYTDLKGKTYPFRVCLGFIDTLQLLESTYDIITHQLTIKFSSSLRTQSKRIQKAQQVSKIVMGHMFLLFRLIEIVDLLKEEASDQNINTYLDYLSGDILQFTKLLIKYDFRPKITKEDNELLRKFGDLFAFLVRNA